MSVRQRVTEFWRLVPKGRLARGAWAAGSLRLAAIPCTLLLQLGLVRLLRPNAYGEFMYAYTWYLSLLPLSALGLHEATVRFVASYRESGDQPALRAFLRWSSRLAAGAAVGIAVIGVGVSLLLRTRMTTTLFWTLVLVWAAIPLGSLAALTAARLRASERFVAALTPQRVVQPLLITGAAYVLALGLGYARSAVTAAAAMLGTVAIVLGLSWWFAARTLRAPGPVAPGPLLRLPEWKEAAMHFLGLTAVPLLGRVDVIMLGILTTTREAGIYATLVQLYTLAGFGFYTLDYVIAPRISALHTANDRGGLQRLLGAATLTSVATTIPIVTVLAVAGHWVLSFFDPGFSVGYSALVVLAMAQLISVAAGPSGRLLSMSGHHRVAWHLSLATASINVALNAVLIPLHGMVGAAFALLISTVLRNAVGVLLSRRRTGVDPSILGTRAILR